MKSTHATITPFPQRFLCTIVLLLSAPTSPASPLDTMFIRGDSAMTIEWTPDTVNTRHDWYLHYGSDCTGSDSVYRHCDFIPGITYKSIAYSYGGEDGYARFREKINRGFLAGSHLCHYNTYGDPSDTIAGTDCSGFVCDLWGVPRVSTRDLYNRYNVIARSDLDAGDILVKPSSHTVLIVEREDDSHFLIWESTSVTNGCRERTIDLSDTYWDAYAPRRYEGLTAGVHVTERRYHQEQFPSVSYRFGHITVNSPARWQGTVELYTLQGKRIASRDGSIDNTNSVSLPAGGGTGLAIIRLRSTNGLSTTIPLTALH